MNVDYDLFDGESSTGSVRHTLCRGALVYDRGEIRHGARPRPLRPALARRRGRRRVVMDADRVIADLKELAELTGGQDGARRVCWTDEWVKARALVREKLEELPVEITTDAAGNVWADLPGEQDGFVIVGSHVDSVPAGGWLDGALGIFAALEALRAARRRRPAGRAAPRRLGRRGGRALRAQPVRLVGVRGHARRSTRCAISRTATASASRTSSARCDVDLAKVHESGAQLEGARAYLELHIEQGPVLESRDESAAAVLGTVGVERRAAVFSGRASHAGATPMDMRQDSFLAAARAALAIRDVGLAHEGGYCTTGGASSDPGVVTAVAGRTELLLDQRHLDAGELAAMLKEADEACETAAEEFGCTVEMKHLWSIPPIPFDERLIGFAKEALGKDIAIPSGPLHDAAEMARLIPTVMIFSKSSPPVSHTPEEDSPEEDLRVAIEVYGKTVDATLRAAADGDLPPRG